MKKLSILAILSIYMGVSAIAQELDIPVNLDWNTERHSWKAKWIAHPSESLTGYGVYHFRRNFSLDNVPEKGLIYISADNKYRLYVNGKFAGMGPAKADLTHWKYDELDISQYLSEGENTLAIQVVNLGFYRAVAQFSSQTALIVQGGEGLEDILDTGMPEWKVKKSDAYAAKPVEVDMVNEKYYVAGPCDSIIGSEMDWGWQTSDFDIASWTEPTAITKGVGRGYMHGVNWMLTPSSLPQMTDSVTRFGKIRLVEGIDANEAFLHQQGVFKVPANTKCKILIDQEHLTVGQPELVLSKGAGSSVNVTYAETLYEADGWKKNRDEVDGKVMKGYVDVFLQDGGNDRIYKPLGLRTYRYVQLEIETADEELVVNDYYGVFTMYPFKQKASFTSEDPWLEKIWDTGWRTARLCAHDTYWDCPYYEQLQYLGDTRIQALISLYNTGDDRLMVNALRLADQSRIPEGLTLSRGPSFVPQIIPAFSLYWIDMIHDYYMHQENSEDLVKELSLGMISVLSWFENRMNDNGLFGKSDWLNFADWTKGYNVGSPFGSDDGNSALLSLNLAYALDRAAELFESIDEPDYSERYSTLSKTIKNAVYTHCMDQNRGLMAETPNKQHFSQHVNIFAVLTDAIPVSDQQELMKKVLNDTSLIQTTIYYKFYLFKALDHCGLGDLYLGQLDTWKSMIEKGLTTFEEGDYDERSDCHAWGASPNYQLLSIVCGIKPASPGFKTVRIAPSPGTLKTIDAKMPHPQGEIRFSMKVTKKGKTAFTISLPGSVSGDFVWKDQTRELVPGEQEFLLK
jgi:alpha-L-rhamnosidase